MKLKDFFPELRQPIIEYDDGLVCGLIILIMHNPDQIYISYRSDLYKGTGSLMSVLSNGKHTNLTLLAAYQNATKREWFNYPTDTVGEALDLKNNLLDEYAKHDIFINVRGSTHENRVLAGLARGGRRSSKVEINGEIFANRKAAALHFGFSESTIGYRIKSDAYPKWKEIRS